MCICTYIFEFLNRSAIRNAQKNLQDSLEPRSSTTKKLSSTQEPKIHVSS